MTLLELTLLFACAAGSAAGGSALFGGLLDRIGRGQPPQPATVSVRSRRRDS